MTSYIVCKISGIINKIAYLYKILYIIISIKCITYTKWDILFINLKTHNILYKLSFIL